MLVGRRGRFTRALAACWVVAVVASCGVRTGLRVGDAGDADALPDRPAPFDVPRDRGFDRPVDRGLDVGWDVPWDRPRDVPIDLACIPGRPVLAGPTEVSMRVRLVLGDVVLLIDQTGSMSPYIATIRENLASTVIPGIHRVIADVQMGVVTFADFPFDPYGQSADRPFTLVSPVTDNEAAVERAVRGIVASNGGDEAEADTEALYQLATGEGYPPWIAPTSCGTAGRLGPLCLRPGARAIILLITDAPAHNGPQRFSEYHPDLFTFLGAVRGPHTWAETQAALRRIDGRVIGLHVGSTEQSRLELASYAFGTGAVRIDGQPLLFEVGSGAGLIDEDIVRAVEGFVQGVDTVTVSARVVDLDPSRPATAIVRAIRPLSAEPPTGIAGADGTSFHGVRTTTMLHFALDLDPVLSVPGPVDRYYPARIEYLANGTAGLGFEDLTIVVPARGRVCPDF